MDIEFIKWMCEKAEGFVFFKENDSHYVHGPDNNRFFVDNVIKATWIKAFYPLLLQRVFRELVKQGKIYHDFNSLRDLIIDEEKMEKWNKHIYEQELKENK